LAVAQPVYEDDESHGEQREQALPAVCGAALPLGQSPYLRHTPEAARKLAQGETGFNPFFRCFNPFFSILSFEPKYIRFI
jgi:hypothetical protein